MTFHQVIHDFKNLSKHFSQQSVTECPHGSRAVLGARDAEASRMESPCLQEASGPMEENRPYM